MRPRLKTALTFTAGLVVGAVVFGRIQMHYVEKFFSQRGWIAANESALNLQLLSSEKRTRFWRQSLLEAMPDLARSVNPLREDPNYAGVLWNIRLAYSLNETPVPKEIEAILSNLPASAAPQCPMPRRKLGLAPLPTSEPPGTSKPSDTQL
jgi:hypothetical protein